jgi:hypothetical protein
MLESIHVVPIPDPMPKPTPEHQRKITRGKIFEIVTVISLILLGTAFLYWRTSLQNAAADPAASIESSIAALETGGAQPVDETSLFGRRIWSFARPITGFTAHVDLIGEQAATPLETAIIWLTPQPGAGAPTEHTLQAAVNGAGMTAQTLVASAGLAFDKAAKTMEFVSDSPRPHDKGVGATDDGWKLTYITYRSYDDAAPQPMLCLVLQRLSAGENEALAVMNRTLYDALNSGRDIKSALREYTEAPDAS